MAVALDFYLEIEAEPAQEFSIAATGRDADRCARLEDNLILEIYKELLREPRRPIVPLAIRMANGIPLGMGCGSSAAARLAAIALAVHFGQLGWNTERILEEAYALEGHPDNVAACWLGGFVAAAVRRQNGARGASGSAERVARDCCASRGAAGHQQSARSAAGRAIRDAGRGGEICNRWRCWGWLLRRRGAICCAWR